MRKMIFAAAVAVSALVASQAQAVELVTNGGFETGDFTGWMQFGNTGFTGVQTGGVEGSFNAFFGPVGSVGGITQTLATVAGQSYSISFALANDGSSPNFFSADFGGTNLLTYNNAGSIAYGVNTFTAVATSASTVLSFGFRQDPSYYFLDAVSVDGASGAVPEPASWAMMVGGFGLAGAAMRRRRSAGFANA